MFHTNKQTLPATSFNPSTVANEIESYTISYTHTYYIENMKVSIVKVKRQLYWRC